MTTKITPEEMQELRMYPNKYAVITLTCTAARMEYAAMFIEKLREYNKANDFWVRHSCECDPSDGFTRWRFAYKTEDEKRYEIHRYLKDEWDKIFNKIGVYREIAASYGGSGLQGCVCPFSVK